LIVGLADIRELSECPPLLARCNSPSHSLA
jgi:hypothetical protein